MGLEIQDGTGSGYRAKVTANNRLKTLSATAGREHFASLENELAFVTSTQVTAATLTVTTTEGFMIYFSNTSSLNMVIQNTIISAGTAGVISRFYKNPTASGVIGNSNSGEEVNLNFGSSKTSGITSSVWDEVGTGLTNITGSEIISSFTMPASAVAFPTNGSLILPPGSTYGISLQAGSGTVECSISMRYYMEELNA